MPSLKMKTTTGCLKEKIGLHVCRKSSVISKSPLSRARTPQDAEEVSICTQSNQDVHARDLGRDEASQDLGRDEANKDSGRDDANHDKLSIEDKVFQKQSSIFTDSATKNTEPTSSKCSSNIETIFSPILESIDLYNNGGSDDLYVPQLDSEDSDDCSRSSCEHQACNISDFYISDMIFSGAPSGNNSQFDNRTDTDFLPDYKFEESSLLCDLTEEYMALPFLEENLDTGHDFDGRPPQETIDPDNSSLYMAIHQLKSCNQDSQINTCSDQDYECFDPQMYIRSLPDQPDVAFSLLPTSVSNEKQNKQITLVLDLDETLVHSTLEHCDDADFTFSVFFNMKEHTVYVRQRPHLQTFLRRVADMFEIVVFTASQSIYAKQLLDILDPEGMLISKRAYREACIFSEGIYTKDLTVLGVDLAKVAIIDNSPQVFRLQVNNGIPIKSWFDDPSDCALISMLPFLESLVDADDVRPIIARKFGNKE
ncbi:uncharacterized protein LOC130985261 isoform X2 [Salvia miltiorrhiza]|uniref:uncharacterized protein LOC130985261 isoform X2 n=1 Tax=Salvia miltiorrhiza TaxID=226208 RepID=UPI0025AB7808|nr:uncharacterized protein LOC130985261 isoform X2 [Salvia miltiorrhiza]XP_057764122.1 uncharacterized protein LOC130985261 isoform X2 [Salvia miltiorrhiza]